jgi:hypothetical protein
MRGSVRVLRIIYTSRSYTHRRGPMKRTLLAVAVVVALAVGLAASRAEGQAKGKPPEGDIGRWQIVQGPPTGIYRTFLIDTATGNTFIVCGSKEEGVEGWCAMPVLQPTSKRQ